MRESKDIFEDILNSDDEGDDKFLSSTSTLLYKSFTADNITSRGHDRDGSSKKSSWRTASSSCAHPNHSSNFMNDDTASLIDSLIGGDTNDNSSGDISSFYKTSGARHRSHQTSRSNANNYFMSQNDNDSESDYSEKEHSTPFHHSNFFFIRIWNSMFGPSEKTKGNMTSSPFSSSNYNHITNSHEKKQREPPNRILIHIRSFLLVMVILGCLYIGIFISNTLSYEQQALESSRQDYNKRFADFKMKKDDEKQDEMEVNANSIRGVKQQSKEKDIEENEQKITKGLQKDGIAKQKLDIDNPSNEGSKDEGPVDLLPKTNNDDTDDQVQEMELSFPESFNNIRDFPSKSNKEDIPMFWHVPKSGGSTIKDIVGGCLLRTMASEVGVFFGHENDEKLEVFEHAGNKFVNVDTTSPAGIEKAKRLNLASSGLPQVIISSYLQEISTVFTPDHQGRIFTLLRHPVDRAVSMLGYLGQATWEQTYDPKLANMTVEEYAQSNMVENNWMTRFLSGQLSGEVTSEHLELAKKILRTKTLIGLLPKIETSMERFAIYYGWELVNRPHRLKCVQRHLDGGSNQNKFSRKKVEKGSQGYSLLSWQNKFDLKLYEYAEELFEGEQAEWFKDKKLW